MASTEPAARSVAPKLSFGPFTRIASIGDLPDDDADTRVLKRAVTLTAVVVIAVTVGWVLIGLASGSLLVVATSVLFGLVVAADLVDFSRRKAFASFAAILMVSSIGVVLIGYATVGGSIAGGTDLGWGILAPIGAIILYGPRRSLPWFAAFLGLVGIALLIDPWIRPLGAPPRYPFSLVLIGFNVIGPGAIAYLLLRYIDGQRQDARAQSERLLLNILPPSIADRLKAGDQRIAEHVEEASVLFADVVDFTPLAERTPAPEVIDLLTGLFTRFDELADRFGLEKIKTVGDAYMAAAGVPLPRQDNARAAVDMAIAMQRSLDDWNRSTNHSLRLRVGIATGPLMAGVIGQRKFAYDLWGDTVNTASRMESTGEPGCIQVTETTHARLEGRYRFVRRENVAVKGKGPMTTYLLDVSEQQATATGALPEA